jgi:AbrB family looped-hinge helix DNA binding protein
VTAAIHGRNALLVVRKAMGNAHATVTSKGQVTIPRSIREQLGIRTGDRLSFVVASDGRVHLTKVQSHSLAHLVGLLGRPRRKVAVSEMDEAIRRQVKKRARRR